MNTIKTATTKLNVVARIKSARYEKSIAASQALLAAHPQIHGYTNIYA